MARVGKDYERLVQATEIYKTDVDTYLNIRTSISNEIYNVYKRILAYSKGETWNGKAITKEENAANQMLLKFYMGEIKDPKGALKEIEAELRKTAADQEAKKSGKDDIPMLGKKSVVYDM